MLKTSSKQEQMVGWHAENLLQYKSRWLGNMIMTSSNKEQRVRNRDVTSFKEAECQGVLSGLKAIVGHLLPRDKTKICINRFGLCLRKFSIGKSKLKISGNNWKIISWILVLHHKQSSDIMVLKKPLVSFYEDLHKQIIREGLMIGLKGH